jgi:putative membrane-bound dehydrogenase-like protein
LKVPPGFTIELVAGPPLVERPIVASFDDLGRLYVAESSGSNDPVKKQLAERPHRIVRLDDADGDGEFDRRVVFADRMMFPEGVQCLDGSVYVSAPPSIWKLTDTNGDGVADERSEWFQGKTLTGCANDLHGPYLGPDGWLYWCKGAFAEQTHIVRGREWKTRAAHVFRCRLDGSGFEPVMTGGMDNPVDVVFTPEGDRILSATYYVGRGRRDGIAHVIYGGVYGKEHDVLDGHPRTGELMPVMSLMSPVAPCGLERYDSNVFGNEYRGNLFACQFNMRRVSRHVLRPQDSTFVSEDSDFVSSDNVDFHPTDVLMDADGSLLVFDTGGWYKLCCPTSQLWKPDVLGGIYRVRREGAKTASDPRGRQIEWGRASPQLLWDLHADDRPAVRQRAGREFVRRRDSDEVRRFVSSWVKRGGNLVEPSPSGRGQGEGTVLSGTAPSPQSSPGGGSRTDARTAALARAWTLGQLDSADGASAIRQLLGHVDESVRHAALSMISLQRDTAAYSQVAKLLANDTPAIRRVAAEALGRMGKREAVPALLDAAGGENDRILQHSIIYALIELADPSATRSGLASEEPRTRAAALMALDQMEGGGIEAKQVIPLLNSSNPTLRDTARWLVSRHTEWGGDLSHWFGEQLGTLKATNGSDSERANPFETMLVEFAVHPAVQQLLAETLTNEDTLAAAKALSLRVMAQAKIAKTPPPWRDALAKLIDRKDEVHLALEAARALPPAPKPDDPLNKSLLQVADAAGTPRADAVAALAVVAGSVSELTDSQFEMLLGALSTESSTGERTAAVDALSKAPLSRIQLERLCKTIESAGPLELNRLLAPYAKLDDEQLGTKLLAAVEAAPGLPSLRIDILRTSLAKYGPNVQKGVEALEARLNVDAASQRKRIEELLPAVAEGDVRRGHAVFHSSKALCSSCHVMGHAGGTVGPELSRIGEIRTERDLLESILYPSLSIVQSYEPVRVITTDGRVMNGTIREETEDALILATGPDQEGRLARDEVEEIEPSTVSVMPGGLDGQLTVQELADLVAFLKKAHLQ